MEVVTEAGTEVATAEVVTGSEGKLQTGILGS